jgi:calmodulin
MERGLGASIQGTEERAFFEAQFKLFDKEGSGHIALDDLGPALQMSGFAPSQAEIQQLKRDADVEGTGLVSFDIFLDCAFHLFQTLHTVEDLKEAFRTFDPDGRGMLSQGDIRFILSSMGEKLTDEEMNNFFVEATTELDTDGSVLYEGLAVKFLPAFLQQ